ncbi:hypothetical protein [Acetatifactor aquisgranensis]|uniref:hypothetical protein n=1 Tax=Acetatifactor aquisgranensis TaxID=2941233 RepID=UPI00204051EA|nr:hypothetical protein [Acetatifactor aquisgranensis]
MILSNNWEKEYQSELIQCARQLRKSEEYLQDLKGQLRILEAENDFLSEKNTEYERKLSLLTNNPLSRAGLRLYHLYHKLRQMR